MAKRAIIIGITGQDGSYLSELLLDKDYEVYGLVPRYATNPFENVEHLLDKITILTGDLADSSSLYRIIDEVQPDELYNLGAQSFVKGSWDLPELTGDVTGVGVVRVLEALRQIKPDTKFYQASSSEMFGRVVETPQKETTTFYPRSPYGVAKVYGHYITVNYRESYDMYACSGILFNHESERRGREFVTRKISETVVKIKLGMATELRLGNLDAKRDWGHAKDYVFMMYLMLQQDKPDDYVIGTGVSHSVQEYVELAFGHVGLDWKKYVVEDDAFKRPAEVDTLLADPTKAKEKLGWEPKVSFEELVKMMVDSDLKKLENIPRR